MIITTSNIPHLSSPSPYQSFLNNVPTNRTTHYYICRSQFLSPLPPQPDKVGTRDITRGYTRICAPAKYCNVQLQTISDQFEDEKCHISYQSAPEHSGIKRDWRYPVIKEMAGNILHTSWLYLRISGCERLFHEVIEQTIDPKQIDET